MAVPTVERLLGLRQGPDGGANCCVSVGITSRPRWRCQLLCVCWDYVKVRLSVSTFVHIWPFWA
eukprot:198216-Chlamydomonas_euryale.AAC.1